MTAFARGDQVRVAQGEGLRPRDGVVVGYESERGENGQVVLRIIVQLDGGTRTVLDESSPLLTRDPVDVVQSVPITGAWKEPVVWRPGTDPKEIAGVLSQYLTDKPDLAEALALETEKQLAELHDDPTAERSLQILSNSADALLARLRLDSPVDRDVRANDLVPRDASA